MNARVTKRLPATTESLLLNLQALGIQHGHVVLVHSSLSALGYVVGGAQSVIEALIAAVGDTGTVVMPAHSGDLSEPSFWGAPPVPEQWWQHVRDGLPAFDRVKTATYRMGTIAESFRHWPGTLRSDHPTCSFAARGPHAERLLREHRLADGFGEHTPLASLYEHDARVLLLGVGHARNTSLHLAERRALAETQGTRAMGVPLRIDGERRWVVYDEPAVDAGDFQALGESLERDTSHVSLHRVGSATGRWMSQREVVDYGVSWLRNARLKPT